MTIVTAEKLPRGRHCSNCGREPCTARKTVPTPWQTVCGRWSPEGCLPVNENGKGMLRGKLYANPGEEGEVKWWENEEEP